MLDAVNIFDDTNKKLRTWFFVYFIIAVCGYSALMVNGYPYNDDYCRYLVNVNVGTLSSGRYLTFVIESFTYLSNVITDAAPFTQVLSCAFLSYAAVICLKIFKINLDNKLQVLCFVPMVVNPYLLEIMLFRFDNPFSTFALLLVVTAAYLSSLNNRKFLIIQSVMFFLSFFMYQAASSAYFIVCAYIFLNKIRDGKTLKQIISEMKHWLYSILIAACCYIPITYSLSYSVARNGEPIVLPKDWESIQIIIANANRYFSNLYVDWSDNAIGQIFFTLFIVFVVNMLTQTYVKTKSIASVSLSGLGIFVFSLCPLGACLLLRFISFDGNECTPPRCLYSIGILISLVCYENCKIFEKIHKVRSFFGFLMSIFCLWNLIFLNSAANIIKHFQTIRQAVLYDASKDIYNIINKNEKISEVCVIGSIKTECTSRFVNLYPIINRLLPEKWKTPYLCQIALMNPDFCEKMLKYIPIYKEFTESNYKDKVKIKETMHYDLYILDKKMLLIDLRNNIKYDNELVTYAQIRDEK